MSTKIYNAYKYTGENIEMLLEDLRECKNWYSEWVIDRITSIFKPDVSTGVLWDIMGNILNGNGKILLNPEDAVLVYPHSGDLYVQFFCKEQVIGDMLSLSGRFVDFHYQNQTDMPDDISVAEWEGRALIWEEIHKDFWSVENGFCYGLVEPYWAAEVPMRLMKENLVQTKEQHDN